MVLATSQWRVAAVWVQIVVKATFFLYQGGSDGSHAPWSRPCCVLILLRSVTKAIITVNTWTETSTIQFEMKEFFLKITRYNTYSYITCYFQSIYSDENWNTYQIRILQIKRAKVVLLRINDERIYDVRWGFGKNCSKAKYKDVFGKGMLRPCFTGSVRNY